MLQPEPIDVFIIIIDFDLRRFVNNFVPFRISRVSTKITTLPPSIIIRQLTTVTFSANCISVWQRLKSDKSLNFDENGKSEFRMNIEYYFWIKKTSLYAEYCGSPKQLKKITIWRLDIRQEIDSARDRGSRKYITYLSGFDFAWSFDQQDNARVHTWKSPIIRTFRNPIIWN